MYDEAWKEYFFDDHETRRSLNSSEVFRNFAAGEMRREAMRNDPALKLEKKLDEEKQLATELKAFQEKVSRNPLLKARLKLAKEALDKNPELHETTDPNFIRGLSMLDLDGDE